MTTRPHYQITRYPIGSLKEIWTISWPLILGLISNGMMIVVDRLMLGHYSLSSMQAATTASAAAFSVFVLPMVVAGISEVFVGTFHGQGKFDKMGSAAWQLIWFSVILAPIFYLASIALGPHLFKNMQNSSETLAYFSIIVGFGSLFCLNPALMGFFVGQGKVRIITITIGIANFLNFALDAALIYGTPFTKGFGIKGAASATVFSQFFLVFVFTLAFLSRKNRQQKGTSCYKIDLKLLFKSLRIGVPASFAHLAEYVGYFLFLKYMDTLGSYYLTIAVLLHNLYIIVFFIIEGMSKGVTAICSNLMGVNKFEYIKKSVYSACKLHILYVSAFAVVVILGSSKIYSIFIGASDRYLLSDPVFLWEMFVSSIFLCLFYFFDGIIWMIVGMLTAASDTRFIMFVGTFAPFILFLFPLYLLTPLLNLSPKGVWALTVLYGVSHLTIYWLRYKSSAWRRRVQLSDPSYQSAES